MLVSIEANGFKAYAPFETAKFLALVQLEKITFEELDADATVPDLDEELPF